MKISLRAITEISVAVALSLILNFLPLWKMPQGGSVSLEMLPIFFIALRWGLKEGLLAGFVYGLLQLAFNPFIIHPVQLILDYPLPYMLLGLSGIFVKQINQYIYHICNVIRWVFQVYITCAFWSCFFLNICTRRHQCLDILYYIQRQFYNTFSYCLLYNNRSNEK